MAVYRYQVICVGFWRGKIKRWNTTFHYSSSSYTASLKGQMSAMCYPNPGDTTGACSGGISEIKVYSSAGGPPISDTVYFDWESPGSWVPFTGTKWTDVPEDTPLDASGESALLVVGNMSALSSSGKPTFTRKYIYAIPSRSATDYSDPDISPTDVTSLANGFIPGLMANPSGVTPATVSVEPYYFNHQRVRGRRRSVASAQAQAFTGGVVLGTGAGSQSAPFPGQ